MKEPFWNMFESSGDSNQPKKWKWKEKYTWLKKKKIASLIEGLIIPQEKKTVAPDVRKLEPAVIGTSESQDIFKTVQITMWTLMMRTPIHKAPLWFHWVDWFIDSYEIPTSEKAIRFRNDDWKILAFIRLLPTGANSAVIKEMHLSMSPTAIAWVINIIWDPKKLHISIEGELYKQIMDYLREIVFWTMTDYRLELPCPY